MKYGRPTAYSALASLVLTLGGCEFEGAQDTAPIEMNSCASSANCEHGSTCRDGMCVAEAAEAPLLIALQVTPLKTADGPPVPITLEPFTVSGPIERAFQLRELTEFSSQITDGGNAIDASVTFTPTAMIPGMPTRPITSTVAQSVAEYTVQLLAGVEYRMLVLPTEPRRPPFASTFVARDVGRIDVRFDERETREQTLTITGGAADRDLLVTAFDKVRGEPISSTATVVKGKATLVFAEDTQDLPFRLQIRAVQSFEPEPATKALPCDTDTPAFPSFSIDDADVVDIDSDDWKIKLPTLPERIRYEGTVELCDEERGNASTITALPVTLQSESLLLADGTPLPASFDATTSATYDEESDSLRFCVQVMPGEYAIRATPPANVRCALFAEHLLVESATKTKDVRGVLLSLPTSAYLAGNVVTSADMPLGSASIEAHGLGRPKAVPLPPDDHSVTSYNRSSETITDSTGTFKIPVDLGSYDVVVKPLAESGFPWQVRTDVGVGLGARNRPIKTTIDMPAPVVVNGSLRYPRADEKAQATLAGAEIDAYALIDAGDDAKRAVPVGKAIADADGKFMLLLPRSVKKTW